MTHLFWRFTLSFFLLQHSRRPPGGGPRRVRDLGGRTPRHQHGRHLGQRQHARHARRPQPPGAALAGDGKDSAKPAVSPREACLNVIQ